MHGRFWHEAWVFFFAFIVVAGVVAGHGLVIGFGVMGLLAGVISWAWNRVALDEVVYERQVAEHRVFIGEEIPITVALTNKKPMPLTWIRVDDEVPDALEVVEGDVSVNVRPNVQSLHHSTSMAWYERIRWNYRLRCTRRGLYRLGPAHVESGDPFGFLRSRKTHPRQDPVLVYPRIFPLDELGIPADRPLGEVRGGLPIFQDPSRPSGLREYQIGDPLKIVDWKSTAKMQALHVRTYEPSTTFTVILVVAIDTAKPYWGSYIPEDLERVVSAAASAAAYAAERHYTLGLFSNDVPGIPGQPMAVAPSRGRDQLSVILGALATTRPYAIGPMYEQLAQESRRFPMGATLVVSAAFIPPEFVQTLNDLKHRGYRMVVMYVGEGPCPALDPGILVYELREHFLQMEEAYGQVA